MRDSNPEDIPDFATLAADPEIAPLLDFEPVVRKVKRPDGWTPELQRELIARIAATGTLQQAVWQMTKHATGAEALYKNASAETFRNAWDSALALGRRRNGLESGPPFTGEVPGIVRRGSSGGRASMTTPLPDIPALPVICDKCAAQGMAGDEAFADIPYLLAFDPVPRPAHDRLWDAPTQRAFVAALAVTGSIERAARSIRRHAFAVEKLRKSRGAREFNEACEAALDVARQRELANFAPSPLAGEGWGEGASDEEAEYQAARERIQMRLVNCRRLYLTEICGDEAKRAAWEVLCGPTDWEKASSLIRSYAASEAAGAFEAIAPNMRHPDMILPVENGWFPEITGPDKDGRDKMAELRESAENSEQSLATRELFERRETSSADDPQSGVDRRHAIHSRDVTAEQAEAHDPAKRPARTPRITNMNSPKAYQTLCPRDERPWIEAGSLPREKRRPRGSAEVQVSAVSDEAGEEAFKEWQAHVEAGRIGGRSTEGKATDAAADE